MMTDVLEDMSYVSSSTPDDGAKFWTKLFPRHGFDENNDFSPVFPVRSEMTEDVGCQTSFGIEGIKMIRPT